MRFPAFMFWGLLLIVPVQAQNAICVRAGLITYAEGKIWIEENSLQFSSDRFNTVLEGQRLQTEAGRVEMQLGLGSFLRMGENSAAHLVNAHLENASLRIESGSALIEVFEEIRGNSITLYYGEALITIKKAGLYRLDAKTGQFRVYGGSAEVLLSGQKTIVKRGKAVYPADSLVLSKFDRKLKDSFHVWSGRRSFKLYSMAPAHWNHWIYSPRLALNRHYGMQFALQPPAGWAPTNLEILQQMMRQKMREIQQRNEALKKFFPEQPSSSAWYLQ